MNNSKINYLAVLACLVMNMLLGMAWFGALATPWMAYIGKPESEFKAAGGTPYIFAILGALIMALTIGWLLPKLGAKNFIDGFKYGFILGFAFIFTAGFIAFAFSLYPPGQALIDFGYPVLSLAFMGGIHGAWKKKA
jgi:hypothetical protein